MTFEELDKVDDKYGISLYGRVKRFSHVHTAVDGKKYYRKEILLKIYIDSEGYPSVDIRNRHHRVHRLLALTFIPNPNKKRTVNHKDGNKLNYAISNLEWATDSENNKHAYDTGLKVGCWTGKTSPVGKKLNQFNAIKELIKSYPSARKAAIENSLHQSQLNKAIKCGKLFKNSYWAYAN